MNCGADVADDGLWPFQQAMIADARGKLRVHNSVLLQAPTGAGKTRMSSHMLGSASKKGKRSWFNCHRIELIEQAAATFDNANIPFGIIADGFKYEPNKAVQICSIDLLRGMVGRIAKPDFIVWDECHHIAADGWSKIKEANQQAKHIGLSATPERLDGKGLDDHFTAMVEGPEVRWLIDQGYLSDYKIFCPPHDAAEFQHGKTTASNAVRWYLEKARGKKGIGFATSIKLSEQRAQELRDNGIVAVHLDGTTHPDTRRQAMADYLRGHIRIVFNVGLFGEGVNVPDAEVLIDDAPTNSLAAVRQRQGRVLRTADGKPYAIIIDTAGNAIAHGGPDEKKEWSLQGKAGREARGGNNGPAMRQCPKCLDPSTPILYADMVWRPIGDAKVGDVVLSFDEHLPGGKGNSRKFREAIIQNVWKSEKASILLKTEHSEVITTEDHKWLGSAKLRFNRRKEWFETCDLKVGDELQFVSTPNSHEETPDYMAGYVAGATKGDGTFRWCSDITGNKRKGLQSYWRIAMKDDAPLNRLVNYLSYFGVSVSVKPFRRQEGVRAALNKVETRSQNSLEILHSLFNWPQSVEFGRGYVSGFFDAEGSHSGAVRFTQVDHRPLQDISKMSMALGYSVDLEKMSKSWANKARLIGGVLQKIGFFSCIQPALHRKLKIDGYDFRAEASKVVSIEALGPREMVDITTSTGTFIAAGLATHNCYAAHSPAPKCPECSHVYVVQGREIEEVDVPLVEFDPSIARRRRNIENNKSESLEYLINLGKERGYKHGGIYWATHYHMNKKGKEATLNELLAYAAMKGMADPTQWAAKVMSSVMRK